MSKVIYISICIQTAAVPFFTRKLFKNLLSKKHYEYLTIISTELHHAINSSILRTQVVFFYIE